MNIPVKSQKVVAYKKRQEKGLTVEIKVLEQNRQSYPAIKLFRNDKAKKWK